MRWLGALSVVRPTEAMWTPVMLRRRVRISPMYSPSPIFLKVPMVAMSFLLAARARDHRSLDGDRQAMGDRRRTRQGRSAAEDGERKTFLPREEWASRCPPRPLSCAGARAQGKKVAPPPLRQGDRW